jgi:hypothetical protein
MMALLEFGLTFNYAWQSSIFFLRWHIVLEIFQSKREKNMHGLKRLQLSLLTLFVTTCFITTAQAIALDQRVRQHSGFYIEGEGFDTRANETLFSDFPFAESNVLATTGTSSTTDHTQFHHFDPCEKWAWRAAVGYDFPSCTCCAYGFSLEYTYFYKNNRRHLADFISSTFEPALSFPGGAAAGGGSTNADASLNFRYNAIDLLGHSNCTFCNCLDVQFFAGARYVNFGETFRDHLFVAPDLIPTVFENGTAFFDDTIYFNNRFNGVGPRVGFNVFYQVACGFGLVTEAAGDLVFGTSRSTLHRLESELFPLAPAMTVITAIENPLHRQGRAVPGLSGKVALAYRAVFCDCSSLVVEAGYRGDKYFGLAHDTAFVQFDDFIASFSKDANYHNFSISGPYISITYHV